MVQQFIKDILIWVYEAGHSETAYLSVELIAALVSICFCAVFGKKIGLGTGKAVLAECIGIVSVFTEMAVFRYIIGITIGDKIPVMNSYLNNVGRTFMLVPFRTLWVSKLLKLDYKRLSSVFALTQAITWGISSLACLFTGCCTGYPWEYGIYNVMSETFVFPTQVINAFCLVMIAIITICKVRKNNYVVTGKEMPAIMMLVAATRFLTEFIMDNNKLVFGLSSLSVDAMVIFIAGFVYLQILKKEENKKLRTA